MTPPPPPLRTEPLAQPEIDRIALDIAYEEAIVGRDSGGIPIGSALVDRCGNLVGRGHNRRVQTEDPTAHAEVDCIRSAGRRRDWPELTLASTLSPCIMCTGTALLYRIQRVVIGESKTFQGAEGLMAEQGVTLVPMNDQRCIDLMETFIAEHPDLWNEDIGK